MPITAGPDALGRRPTENIGQEKERQDEMLNNEQKKAVSEILEHVRSGRDCGLTGWAGTGKTFATAEVIRALEGRRVAVLAPTHRACGVLRGELEGAGVYADVTTIHAGCGLIPDERTGKAREVAAATASGADVVIVDEASMVSTDILSRIRKLPGVKVFVGDPYQLPPVGEDTPPAFHGLPCARLTMTVRYAAGSDLDEMTSALRACIDEGRAPDIAAIEERMQFSGGGVREAARLFHEHDDAVVVAYQNDVVARVCAAIQGVVGCTTGYTFLPGEPVVFQDRWAPWDEMSRKHTKRCDSGTEAVIVSYADNVARLALADGREYDAPVVPPGQVASWLRLRGVVVGFYRSTKKQWQSFCDARPIMKKFRDASAIDAVREMSQYACVRQAWATTAHKAQGGSYGRVVVMWDDLCRVAKRDPSLFSRLLYVAVTRTRDANELHFVKG